MFQSQPIQRRLLTPWFLLPGALTSPERGRVRGRGWPPLIGVTCRGSPGSPSPTSPLSGSRSFCDDGCSRRDRDDRVVISAGLWLRNPLVLHLGRQCLRRGCTDRTGDIMTIIWYLDCIGRPFDSGSGTTCGVSSWHDATLLNQMLLFASHTLDAVVLSYKVHCLHKVHLQDH